MTVEYELLSKGDADVARLEEEIKQLRAELFKQWEYNHTEHCGREFPHDNCQWPMPKVLVFGLKAPNEVLRLPSSGQE
jgi:hypothetical protein